MLENLTEIQIRNLKLDEVFSQVLYRLLPKKFGSDYSFLFLEDETGKKSLYERLEVTPEKPTLKEFEDELKLFKDELLEQARIKREKKERYDSLKNRIDKMEHVHYAHHLLFSDIPNSSLFFKEKILENENHQEAEQFLKMIEQKHVQVKKEIDSKIIDEKRRSEYPSIEEIVIALLEKDELKLSALRGKRRNIKNKYPREKRQNIKD